MSGTKKTFMTLGRWMLWGTVGIILLFAGLLTLISKWADRATIPAAQRLVPEPYRLAPRWSYEAQLANTPSQPVAAMAAQPALAPSPHPPQGAASPSSSFDALKLEDNHNHCALIPYAKISAAQQEQLDRWLSANNEYLDGKCREIEQLSPNGPPDTKDGWMQRAAIFNHRLRLMLQAAGWKALRDSDSARFERITLALLRLSALETRDPRLALESFLIIPRLNGAIDLLTAGVADTTMTTETVRRLRQELDPFTRQIFDRANLLQIATQEYVRKRNVVVSFYDDPWNSQFFGWEPDIKYFREFHLLRSTFLLPRPLIFASEGFQAIRRKRGASQGLRLFDAYWQDRIACFKLSYEALCAHESPEIPSSEKYGHLVYYLPQTGQYLTPWLVAETRFNLVCAALDWRLHPEQKPPMTSRIKLPPGAPWRDPFTEGPLRIETETTVTTIYSLGPDMTDQQGRKEFPLSSEVPLPGDITLRLRHGPQ